MAPYVIFHDATLLAMVEHRPSSLEALGEISGVGERKLARYGGSFLAQLQGQAAKDSGTDDDLGNIDGSAEVDELWEDDGEL